MSLSTWVRRQATWINYWYRGSSQCRQLTLKHTSLHSRRYTAFPLVEYLKIRWVKQDGEGVPPKCPWRPEEWTTVQPQNEYDIFLWNFKSFANSTHTIVTFIIVTFICLEVHVPGMVVRICDLQGRSLFIWGQPWLFSEILSQKHVQNCHM